MEFSYLGLLVILAGQIEKEVNVRLTKTNRVAGCTSDFEWIKNISQEECEINNSQ